MLEPLGGSVWFGLVWLGLVGLVCLLVWVGRGGVATPGAAGGDLWLVSCLMSPRCFDSIQRMNQQPGFAVHDASWPQPAE